MSTSSFMPTKIHHLLCYVLRKLNREVGTVELVKYIYLIDAAYYRLFGATISKLNFIREEKGPYTKDITNAVSELELHEINKVVKPSKNHSRFMKIAHTVGNNPRFEPILDSEEKVVVDQVIKELKSSTPMQLEAKAYETEPMQYVQDLEKKAGALLRGINIDFSKIKRDEYMLEVLKNRMLKIDDPQYEASLDEERLELKRLLV